MPSNRNVQKDNEKNSSSLYILKLFPKPVKIMLHTIYHDIIDIHDTTAGGSAEGAILVADFERLCAGWPDDSDLPSIDSISISALIFRQPRLLYSCSRRCCSAN